MNTGITNPFSLEKANNQEGFQNNTQEALSTRTKEEALTTEGIANDKKVEPVPYFRKAPCESYAARGENNQWIVIGRDRPGALESGYGGRGDTKAGAIDIVVGRKIPDGGIVDSKGDRNYVNPNFSEDAARIHISQRTNIDNNFNLKDGGVGNSIARSGIGIKADSVRVIGREGIKLVTRADEKNSIEGPINRVKGIDLIAGNNTSGLQPMVKGANLKEFLVKIQKDISALTGMINSLATKQIALDAALGSHTHPIVAIPVNTVVVGAAGTGFANGVTFPSPELAAATAADTIQITVQDQPSHVGQQVNTAAQALDYLNPISPKYILSKFNKTN